MHPLHDYVAKQLADKLKAHHIVVWSECRSKAGATSFGDPKTAALKVLGG